MRDSSIMTLDDIQMPRNMHLKEKVTSLEFEYSWFKGKYLLAFILAPVFAYYLINSVFIAGDIDHISIPGFLILLFTFFILYYSIVKLINTTRIIVTRDSIVVRHGPLPSLMNFYLKKEDITQLFVTKFRRSHRYYLYDTTYQINVILKDERVITLVSGLQTAEQGRFIEQKIEDFFNITDVPVQGEIEK